MTLQLPYPPSANTYWRSVQNRVLISKKGREYRKKVCKVVAAKEGALGLSERLSVTIDVFPPDRRRRDLDNVLKALLDALTAAGVWLDDSQLDRIEVIRRPVIPHGGMVVVVIEAM